MGWQIGYDENWQRDIGYGVPAFCDYPDCGVEIDRGLSYVCCENSPYGGEHGCGLHFCSVHRNYSCSITGEDDELPQRCVQCIKGEPPFQPTRDHPDWVKHKLNDQSWAKWREENSAEVGRMKRWM